MKMAISHTVRRFLSLLLVVFLASASLLLVVPHKVVAAQNIRDCDNNAVINCGALSVTDLKLKGNIRAIFKHFGINSVNDFNGLVMGTVTNTNQVFLGNKLVATNAITAGRQNLPGSTPILGGLAFQRPPSVSFTHSRLDAFIKMNDNKLQFAVLASCGNPVIATPVTTPPKPPQPAIPKTPNFTINKTVKLHNQTSQFAKSVTAQSGDRVDFKIVIHNSGQVKLTDMTLSDDLPLGMTFVNGSFSGVQSNTTIQTLPSDLTNILSSSSFIIGDLAVDQTVTIIFSATVDNDIEACTPPLVNKATAQPNQMNSKSSQANVQVCVSQPVVTPITPVTTTPAPPAKVVVQPAPTIINTGAGSILGLFTLAGAGGTLWHQIYMRLLRKLS
jgi:uncharacterized repeat protein (TIGR01451 family)